MQSNTNPVARIFDLVKLERKEITAIYFYAILGGLIQLSLPVGVQSIIGFVMGGSMVTSLVILIIFVVLGVLIYGVLQIGQMGIIEKIQQKIFVRYAFSIAGRLPAVDMKKTDTWYLPELMNRFFEVPILQKGLAKLLLDIPAASIQILFGLILLSLYHPAFILFGLVLLLILWLILYYSGNRGLETSISESSYKYSVAAWLEEMARMVKTFKYAKGTQISMRKTDERTAGYLDARNQHFRILKLQFGVLVGFKVLITAAMLIVGSVLLVNQQLNIGQFIAAEIVILTVINSVEKLIVNLDSVYDVMTSAEKIGVLTEKPTETSGTLQLERDGKGIGIEFRNVSFGYADRGLILNNLSFRIEPGQKVCISGPEGSGKSTLLRLLSGAYPEFEGSMLINGLPAGNYDIDSLRAQCGILLSQQDIFHGTLLENCTMGDPNADPEELKLLLHKTGLDQFVATLDKGLDAQLEPGGKRLSRSVIHKILLVRALLGQPRLLLLEEPWLGMEPAASKQLQQLILEEMPGSTILVSTHDETFAQRCNQVIRLQTIHPS
jgi:ATP-binding cassette, subfamily B, bacterial